MKNGKSNKSKIDGSNLYNFLIEDYLSTDKKYFTKIAEWIYKNLSMPQKDFLKYNDGWPKKEFDELDINVKALYSNQYPTNFKILKKGFKYVEKKDKTNGDDKDESKFKNAFPQKFLNSTLVNKKSLEMRANSNELAVILNKISQLL